MTEPSQDARGLVDAVLGNLPTSRVPVGFWFHFLGEAETGDASERDDLLAANIEGHRKFIAAFKPDLVKIMSDGFFLHPAKGPLESPAQAAKAIEALGAGHPWIDRQAALASAVADLSPGTRRFYNVFSPSTTLRFMIGRERLLAWLREEKEATAAVLGKMAQTLAALAKAVVASGRADGIYFSVQNPDLAAFSDQDYSALLKEGELGVLAASRAEGGRDILHICGYAGIRNRLAFFQDYPASMISWAAAVEGVPLGAGKRLFGGRAVVGGFQNIPGSIIHQGTEAEIKAKAREILAESGRVGVILGADCTVPSDTELRRLEWAREAAAEPTA
jgi:uroporphyrinogen decarboxylase